MLKSVHVEGIGQVIIARRRGTKHLRISLPKSGGVRLSIPYNVSEENGIDFLLKKEAWIKKHIQENYIFRNGQRVGKAHYIKFVSAKGNVVKSSVSENEIRIFVPPSLSLDDKKIQLSASKAVKRTLQKEADTLLPSRTRDLSVKHNIPYKSVSCKPLKSRWGSCSNLNEIILNTYLLQLEWGLIDYVIIHELAHTIHHNHSSSFWTLVGQLSPRYKELRNELKKSNSNLNV